MQWAKDIAAGMNHLHTLASPRIHRDLKSGNIFISDRWIAKIGDFGTATLIDIQVQDNGSTDTQGDTLSFLDANFTRTMTAGAGSLLWMSPERLCERPYGQAADVYR